MSAKIELSTERREALMEQLQQYFDKELEQELGQFEAQFLLDFIADNMGPMFYNQGVQDAQTLLQTKTDDLIDALAELEKY